MIKQVKLENYIKIISGFAFKSNLFTTDSSFTPLIRIRDIKRGFSETFYSGDFNKNYLVYEGDMLIGMDGEFNVENWKGIPSLLNQRVCKLEISDSNLLDKQYLFYIINGKLKEIEDKTSFVTVKHLSLKDINRIEIPLPPLSTQKAIAEKLDKADALRKKDKELLAQYDELAQAIFIDMFGDPVKNEKGWKIDFLKNMTLKIGSGSTPKGGKENYKSEGISLIRSMNVYDRQFLYRDLAYIDENQAEKLKNVIVESGDILFNITGASVCRSSIVPDNVLPARVNQHVSLIRPKLEYLNNHYLSNLLISDNVKQQLLKIGSGGGAVMEAITKEQLENYKIIIPPLNLQIQFAEKIQNIEAQKALLKQQAQQSEDLFQALLQESFNF